MRIKGISGTCQWLEARGAHSSGGLQQYLSLVPAFSFLLSPSLLSGTLLPAGSLLACGRVKAVATMPWLPCQSHGST